MHREADVRGLRGAGQPGARGQVGRSARAGLVGQRRGQPHAMLTNSEMMTQHLHAAFKYTMIRMPARSVSAFSRAASCAATAAASASRSGSIAPRFPALLGKAGPWVRARPSDPPSPGGGRLARQCPRAAAGASLQTPSRAEWQPLPVVDGSARGERWPHDDLAAAGRGPVCASRASGCVVRLGLAESGPSLQGGHARPAFGLAGSPASSWRFDSAMRRRLRSSLAAGSHASRG